MTLSAVCTFELKYIAANRVYQYVWNSSLELAVAICMKVMLFAKLHCRQSLHFDAGDWGSVRLCVFNLRQSCCLLEADMTWSETVKDKIHSAHLHICVSSQPA